MFSLFNLNMPNNDWVLSFVVHIISGVARGPGPPAPRQKKKRKKRKKEKGKKNNIKRKKIMILYKCNIVH